MMPSLLQEVEKRLIAATCSAADSSSMVFRAVHYHLLAGGSRLRARLCLHASVHLGLAGRDAITLATICELLHNASLVQDDLIDRASPRRGLPSVWSAFDDATAICAGDLLLAAAFQCIADVTASEHTAGVLRLVHQRTRDVIIGQIAETGELPASLSSYEVLAAGKSASLLSLTLELPLLLSRNGEYLYAAHQAASSFAVAYQMVDDLEDYAQDLEAGSLNALSVALAAGSVDISDARVTVCTRALDLLRLAIDQAGALPRDCAGLLRAHAQGMITMLEARELSCMVHDGA